MDRTLSDAEGSVAAIRRCTPQDMTSIVRRLKTEVVDGEGFWFNRRMMRKHIRDVAEQPSCDTGPKGPRGRKNVWVLHVGGVRAGMCVTEPWAPLKGP